MTDKRTSEDPPHEAEAKKSGTTKADDAGSGDATPDVPEPNAAAAKASVHEAIGKLIGDDTERRRGTADKEASRIALGNKRKRPSP